MKDKKEMAILEGQVQEQLMTKAPSLSYSPHGNLGLIHVNVNDKDITKYISFKKNRLPEWYIFNH